MKITVRSKPRNLGDLTVSKSGNFRRVFPRYPYYLCMSVYIYNKVRGVVTGPLPVIQPVGMITAGLSDCDAKTCLIPPKGSRCLEHQEPTCIAFSDGRAITARNITCRDMALQVHLHSETALGLGATLHALRRTFRLKEIHEPIL